MKKIFNDNSNIDLFQNFDKFSKVDEDIQFFEENTKRLFENIDAPKKAYQSLIKNKYKEYFLDTPKKITKDEKELIDTEYRDLISFKNRVDDKIDLAEVAIKKSMEKRGVEYILPIVKNKKLKRASKRFFGKAKREITFEDYQKALKRKKELEKAESASFLEGSED